MVIAGAPALLVVATAWATGCLVGVALPLAVAAVDGLGRQPDRSRSSSKLPSGASRRASAPANTAVPPGGVATDDPDSWRTELHGMSLEDVLRHHGRARPPA